MALTQDGIMEVPGLLSRYVRLASGCKAHYVTAGETGPSVLLLHGGIPGSSGIAGWRYMAPFLGANGFRVYCPDFPGYGLTGQYEDAYPPDEAGHVDFLHDFVTTMCLDKFHISGNSMGCTNSVNYVTAHPERILSYALIAGSIGDIVPTAELIGRDSRSASERPNLAAFDGSAGSMRALMEAIILDPSKITDDLVSMRTTIANMHSPHYLEKRMHAAMGQVALDSALRLSTKGRFDKMTIPGIYLYGTKDVLFPHTVAGYAQEDALPHVQFFYPEETGHQGQTDQPELFNRVFLEFFRDGKVTWETAQAAGISTRRPALPGLVSLPDTVTA